MIGSHKIPENLRRPSTKDEEIVAWARDELNGQEPALTKAEIKQIKEGERESIFLRPRKPGFFLPNGTFVEAFNYSPEFGDDLKDAAGRWDVEESDRKWADRENAHFNKSTASGDPRFSEMMWEHGRRIAERAMEQRVAASRYLILLDERSAKESYRRHTHQTALDFYRWIPDHERAAHFFKWRWERIDSVIRFSSVNSVRDCVAHVLGSSRLGTLRDDQISRLLGVKTRSQDSGRTLEQQAVLSSIRTRLKQGEVPSDELIEQGIVVVTSGSSVAVNRRIVDLETG